MSVLLVMLPASLLLALAALFAFVRSVRRGQYDDVDTPPLRMLVDDEPPARR